MAESAENHLHDVHSQNNKITDPDCFVTVEYQLDNPHCNEILSCMKVFQEKDILTDVTIEVGNDRFSCHKLVLATSSPYFKALLRHSPVGSDIKLPSLSALGFSALIDYIYGCKLQISMDNVVDVLEAADFLQYREVVEVCSNILLQHIDTESCLAVSQLAAAHGCRALEEAAHEYILSNFEKVMCNADFVKLPTDAFTRILLDPKLVFKDKQAYIEAVYKWISFEEETRIECTKLLQTKALTEECIDAMREKYQFLKFCTIHMEVGEVHQPCPGEEVLVSIPTETVSKRTHDVLYLDAPGKCWRVLSKVPLQNKSMYSVCVYNNRIYITGGEEEGVPSNEVVCFDELTRKWYDKQPMLKQRSNHSSVSTLGRMYVIGGKAHDTKQNIKHLRKDGEEYNEETDQWTLLPNIDKVGIGHCCVVPLGDKVYVLGGFQSVECPRTGDIDKRQFYKCLTFDLKTRCWENYRELSAYLASQSIKIKIGECLPYKGLLLMIEDDRSGKKTRLYNPVTNSKYDFFRSHGQHRFGGYAIKGNRLYCAGGVMDRFCVHSLVHSKDLTDVNSPWQLETKLPHSLSHNVCLTLTLHTQKTNEEIP